MGVEIEGVLGSNDYKVRRFTQTLRDRNEKIFALESRLEETIRAAAEREVKLTDRIETLTRSLKNYKCRAAKPREKPPAETKGESPGGASQDAG